MRVVIAVTMALAVVMLSCSSKPPRKAVDVDTMREASFVNDPSAPMAPVPAAPSSAPPEDDTPVPAANGSTPMTPTGNGTAGLPPPEILSRKIERDDPGKPTKKPTGKEKITAAECSRMFDHFFDLVLSSDERFKDLGPEARDMVRQISAQDARFQSMQKDCEGDVSRTKFNCAMGSKTSAAWQTCVK